MMKPYQSEAQGSQQRRQRKGKEMESQESERREDVQKEGKMVGIIFCRG